MAKLDSQRVKVRVAKRGRDDTPSSGLQGRGLIYIDTDDDVTSIVGKIKAAKETVVALVPPKRIGVLQSAVNLKLLQRAAKLAHKRLSIVTLDKALTNLASGLAIPVAKNINAQARLLEVDNVDDDDDDIIDGSNEAIGRLDDVARESAGERMDDDISVAVAAIETDDHIKNDADGDGVADNEAPGTTKRPTGKRIKIPDIGDLRKKILLIGGGLILLIGLIVWALVIAPQAIITIKAKTTAVDIERTLNLVPSGERNDEQGILPPVIKQKKANEIVQFNATGTKEVGTKATGTVAFCYNATPNDSYSDTPKKNSITIEAGTRLYASGMQFTTDGDVTVIGGKDASGECKTYHSVKATAVNIGPEGNIEKNTALSVSGYSSSKVTALAKVTFSGGNKQTVKVVSQADVDTAVAALKKKGDSNAAKKDLASQMSGSVVTIGNSFSVGQSEVKVSPAVGEQSSGQATASMEITYTLMGVSRGDLKGLLSHQLNSKKRPDQKIYSDGAKEIAFSGFAPAQNGYVVAIKTTGKLGPQVDEASAKRQATGRKSEEVKSLLKQTEGVSDVNVALSPFWVSRVPAVNKIKVVYTVDQ